MVIRWGIGFGDARGVSLFGKKRVEDGYLINLKIISETPIITVLMYTNHQKSFGFRVDSK